jgi:PrtD family type I secretion system ABC transporter
LNAFIQACRRHLFWAALFSLVLNLLALALPFYTLEVFDRVFASRSVPTLVMLTMVTTIALVGMMLLDQVRARLLMSCAFGLDRALGPQVVTRLFAEAGSPGHPAQTQYIRDIANVRGFLTGPGVIALFDAPWAPLFLLLIFVFHPLLGIVATVGALVLLVCAWINSRVTRHYNEVSARASRTSSQFIDASVRNADAVRAMGMATDLGRRWGALNDEVIRAGAASQAVGAPWTGLTRFVRLYLQVLMLGCGAWLVVRGDLGSGAMMAGTLILARALSPVEAIVSSWRSLFDFRESVGRLSTLLEGGDQVREPHPLPRPTGRLDVEALTMTAGQRVLLRNVGFSLQAGQQLAVIGPSGAGKTALLRLLAGIWTPASGAVRLDGARLQDYPPDTLGPAIGYLPQNVELFPGTVAENIARMQPSPDADAVIDAAQLCGAHELILRLPQGYDTEVGEGGAQLSAGQRARVGIARALYGSPALVLLDEPNANLDAEGEDALLGMLARLRERGITAVVVAHRPRMLQGMDKLLVLRDGSIEQFGDYAEIAARVTRSPRVAALNDRAGQQGGAQHGHRA